MKFNFENAEKAINKAFEDAQGYTRNLRTVDGCNDYLEKVVSMFQETKEKINNMKSGVYELDEIKEDLKQGKASELFEVGDELHFELLNGEPVEIVCIGKNHDKMEDGKKAKLTFAFKTCPDGEFFINKEYSNAGGWKKCYMRNITLVRFFKLLPKEIQDLIVPVVKLANNGNDEIEEVVDKLFLMSVREYTGTDEDCIAGEGEQYEYFKQGNEFLGQYWWTRSPSTSYNYSWNFVNSYGSINYNLVNYTNYVRPCFCIN